MRQSKLMSKVYDKDSNEGPDIKLKEKPVKKIEEELLTRLIVAEAGIEDTKGRIAVANVVMNRLSSPLSYLSGGKDNKKSISNVIQYPNAFESYTNNNMFNEEFVDTKSDVYKEARVIAKKAISGELPDVTDGATHFLNPDVVLNKEGKLPSWYYNLEKKMTIGNHEFLYEGIKK